MIDGLKPYSEYRDSTHPWLGKVPSHWGEKRAKYFYREVDERSTTGEEELMSVSHKTGVTPRKSHVTMFMAESNVGHKVCRPDDLVINTMWAFMAALGVARQVGVVSPSYGVYRPIQEKELHPDYMDRLLRIEDYKSEYLCRSTGIRSSRLRLYPDQFLRIPILCPPPEEQAAIVRFLDHVDRRVRRYIRAKRQLIALLNEQKQAIIHRAVTRGLDPNVKLKPSGIEWLGDVPVHWSFEKLRALVDIRGGMTPSKSESLYWSGPIPWVSPKDMKFDEITGSIDHISEVALSETNIQLIEAPAVLIVVRGMILARTFPVAVTAIPVTINQDMKALVPRGNVIAEYFRELLVGMTGHVKTLIEESGHGTRVLRTEMWRDLVMPIPPRDEQRRILDHVRETLEQIERVRSGTESQIKLMLAYRDRMVSDVVTGAVNIRDAEQSPDEADTLDVEEDLLLQGDEIGEDSELDVEREEVDA